MPRLNLTQPEISALLTAVVSREMELQDAFSDEHTTIQAYEDYEGSEVTPERVAEAEAEITVLEAEADALESAAQKLAGLVKRST